MEPHGGRRTKCYGFSQNERIRKRKDYERLKRKGKRIRGKHFIINYAENGLECHRLGLVVPKRYFKKAVERNRLKRCVREWFRLHKHDIDEPYKDLVVIAIGNIEDLSCRKVAKELCGLCSSAGLGRFVLRL